MFSLYALPIYGITLNQVKKLVKAGITLKDFEEQTEKINDLIAHKPALVEKITEIIPYIKNEEQEDNLYQLAHEGISSSIINILIDLNINYHDVEELTIEKFNELMGGNRKSVYKKIITAFEKIETTKGRVSRRSLKEALLKILSNLKFDEMISVDGIEEGLSRNHLKINGKVVQSILDELHAINYIEYDSQMVKRYHPKLIDYIGNDFKDKEIFVKRLQGQSLAQLAKDFQYSRQGIRNIEQRVIKRMPVFAEDLRYRAIFEKFDIPQELFSKMFEEPIEVYHYLNAKLKKGNLSILDDIFNPKYTEMQRRVILRYYNLFIGKQGEIKEISKMSIFEEVLIKYALNAVTDEEIIGKFNEYIIKNNFPESYLSEESSIRGISDRCQVSIKGKGNTYRYYDFDVISNDVIDELTGLLELESGVYSMKKIFRESTELMKEIDIRTEYELHNLYRRLINVDNLIYNRMPEFTVGNVSKKDFLLNLFKEYSPIPLKEFVENVEEIYGLRKDSLSSFITGYLNEYIHDDIIKTDYEELSNEEYKQLRDKLINPIYSMQEVKEIGKSIGDGFEEKFINNMTLSKVGYQIRSSFVLSKRYNSVDDYFRSMILSQDYFINEHLPVYRTQSFSSVVYNLEKNFEIFKVEKDVYITYKKLSEAGIMIDNIMDYKFSLLEFIEEDENKYFTLFSIREDGFENPLDELGFSDIFYERLICAFEEFRAIQTSNVYIFKKTNQILSLKEFLSDYVSERRIVKLEDLIDEIKDVYDIVLDTSKVIYVLRQTDVFYSEELHKFYIDKEDFFEEVYE